MAAVAADAAAAAGAVAAFVVADTRPSRMVY